MKKLLVVSFVFATALAFGCSKKNPQTTPTGTGTQTEMKGDGAMGGATYGGATYGGATYGGATYGGGM